MFDSSLTSLPLIGRGKVRDLYRVDDQYLLIVTTDRLSTFDVVLPTPIFTPATKAKAGDHDENISCARMEDLIGAQLAARIRDTAADIARATSEKYREALTRLTS